MELEKALRVMQIENEGATSINARTRQRLQQDQAQLESELQAAKARVCVGWWVCGLVGVCVTLISFVTMQAEQNDLLMRRRGELQQELAIKRDDESAIRARLARQEQNAQDQLSTSSRALQSALEEKRR